MACHILDLPPELRLRIYSYVFEPATATLAVRNDGYAAVSWPENDRRRSKGSSGLIFTCKTIFNEAEPMLTKNVDWKIEMYTWNFRRYGEERSIVIGRLGSESCTAVLRRIQRVKIEAYAIMQAGELVKNVEELVRVLQSIERRRTKLEVGRVGLNFMYLDPATQSAVSQAFAQCRPQQIVWGRNHARPQSLPPQPPQCAVN